MKKNFSKLLALYLPYFLLGLAATNFGEAWQLAEGKEMGDRILSLMSTIPVAFANPLPSLHPLDILVGICCGAGLRLAVYLKSKNAKKYRHGMEYGSARWGNAKDIEPFQAPKFEDNMDEYLLAGFLRRRPVKLVKCITNDIYVPADCDFVIEGYVDPSEPKTVEGPFGDHTGFYSLTDEYPRFHVTAVTRRRDAVYPATLVGIPPQEDAYIAKATEKIFLAPIRLAVQPEVKELTMPVFGTAHNLAVVSIDRRYRGQAHKVAQGLWGAGQMMFNKYLVITGEDCDVHDPDRLAALLRRAEFPRDLIVSEGVYDVLDHATVTSGFGGKLAFDLTEIDPSAPAEAVRVPERFELTPGLVEVADGLAGKWGALLLFADDAVEQKPDLAAFLARNPCRGIRYAVLFDGHARTMRPDELLWLAAANTDPRRDVECRDGVLCVDARSKRPGIAGNPSRFPNVVTSLPEVVRKVDERWAEYGLGERLESPSDRYRALLLSDKAAW